MTNSTSDIRVLKKDSKVVPHYLRVSDGSCHNNCKNGYKPPEPELKIPYRRKLLSRTYSNDKDGKNSTVDTILARHGERQRINELRTPRKQVEDSKSCTTLIEKQQPLVKKVAPRLTKMGTIPSNNLMPPIIDKDDDQTKPRLANLSNRRRLSEVIVRKETSRRLSDVIDRRKTIFVAPNAQHSSSRPSSAKGGLSKNIRKENLRNSNRETRHNHPHVPEIEPMNEKKTESSWDENQLTSILHDDGLSKNIRKENLCNSNIETRHDQPHIPDIALPTLDKPLNEKKTESSWGENEVSSSQLTSILHDDNEDITKNERSRKRLEENVETDKNMKFKRGTIIDVENEDNCAGRLNFNQGNIISQLDEVGKEEIELREVVPMETTRDENGDSEKINLKHVDELEKDNPTSLDNMIEEAASKLVRTRKNKVKALVSAFETVMHIQDAKSLVRKRSL